MRKKMKKMKKMKKIEFLFLMINILKNIYLDDKN